MPRLLMRRQSSREVSQPATNSLRHAWWALAATPLAFIAATLLGNGLLSLLGDDPDAEESIPLGHALLAGIPATLVLIAPALLAVVLGREATRHGERRGRTPAVLGSLVAFYVVAASVVSVIFR
jgi:hypothetical protein